MIIRCRAVVRCTLAALILLQGACAMPVSDGSRPPSAMASISVHAANDSPEIVHVFFISDTGFRQRIGTVAPYGRAKFTARMSRNLTGAFHIHRLSEAAASSISGAVEPFFLADRTVMIRIGPESSFDWWQVGN